MSDVSTLSNEYRWMLVEPCAPARAACVCQVRNIYRSGGNARGTIDQRWRIRDGGVCLGPGSGTGERMAHDAGVGRATAIAGRWIVRFWPG